MEEVLSNIVPMIPSVRDLKYVALRNKLFSGKERPSKRYLPQSQVLLADIENVQLREVLGEVYGDKSTARKVLASLINSLTQSGNVAFAFSQAEINRLIKRDPNINQEKCHDPRVIWDFLINSGHMFVEREPDQRRKQPGICVIASEYWEFISPTATEEVEEQIEAVSNWLDSDNKNTPSANTKEAFQVKAVRGNAKRSKGMNEGGAMGKRGSPLNRGQKRRKDPAVNPAETSLKGAENQIEVSEKKVENQERFSGRKDTSLATTNGWSDENVFCIESNREYLENIQRNRAERLAKMKASK